MVSQVRGTLLVAVAMLATGCATRIPAGASCDEEPVVALALDCVGTLPSQFEADLILAASPCNHGKSTMLVASSHSIHASISLVTLVIHTRGVQVEEAVQVSLRDPSHQWRWDDTGYFISDSGDCASVSRGGSVRLRPHIHAWKSAVAGSSAVLQHVKLLTENSELVMTGPGSWSGHASGRVLLGYFVDGNLVSSGECTGVSYEFESTGMYAKGQIVAGDDGSCTALLPGGSIWSWVFGGQPRLVDHVPGTMDQPAETLRWTWACDMPKGAVNLFGGDARRWYGLNGQGQVVVSISVLETNGTRWSFVSASEGGILAVGFSAASRDAGNFVLTAMYHELGTDREFIAKGALRHGRRDAAIAVASVDDTEKGFMVVTTDRRVFRVGVKRLVK